MITAASLREFTVKDLSQMAKKQGVEGWHSMRKEQLVRALLRLAKASANRKKKKKAAPARRSTAKASPRKTPVRKAAARRKPADRHVSRRIEKDRAKRELRKDLAQETPKPTLKPAAKKRPNGAKAAPVRNGRLEPGKSGRDRIVLMVRDAYWLHACWEVARQSVERAKAAMAEQWHTCKPILRLYEVETSATTATSERVERDIEIHGGVKNWYIDVAEPPKSYRVEIGYLAATGRFFAVARSNLVTTPNPGSSDAIDENWSDVAENYEKIYAQSTSSAEEHAVGDLKELFEERLRRPMGSPVVTGFGVGAERLLNRDRDFQFEVDAEMIIFGRTKPDAHVMLCGDPVELRPDGTFTVRLSMPDRRQVLPVVASSVDGIEQRTIVLAVERNTKVMEPVVRESGD